MKDTKYIVEDLDQAVIDIAEDGTDQQLRCCIVLNGVLKRKFFEQAIQLSLQLEDILLHNLDDGFFKAKWVRGKDTSINQIYHFEEVGQEREIDEVIDTFLLQKIDTRKTPQIRIGLFRFQSNDYVLFIIHHNVTDSVGLLEYIKKLADKYNKLCDESSSQTLEYKAVDRSLNPLLKKYSYLERLRLMFKDFDTKMVKVQPFSWNLIQESTNKFALKYKISKEKMDEINSYCYRKKCTLNDYILAVFYKSFFTLRNEISDLNLNENPIYVTVNFRSYCRNSSDNVVYNFSSGIPILINLDPHLSVELILEHIIKKTQKYKVTFENFNNQIIPGLNSTLMFKAMSKILPFKLLQKLIRSMQKRVYGIPYISNIGDIGKYMAEWGGVTIKDAYLMGQVDYHPAFSMTISQYNGELTLSVVFEGDNIDKERVIKLFELIDENCIK